MHTSVIETLTHSLIHTHADTQA